MNIDDLKTIDCVNNNEKYIDIKQNNLNNLSLHNDIEYYKNEIKHIKNNFNDQILELNKVIYDYKNKEEHFKTEIYQYKNDKSKNIKNDENLNQ
jgi:hypothetical protein